MKKLFILIALGPLSFIIQPNLNEQDIDSLKKEYRKAGADTSKVLLANELAYKYALVDPEKGIKYSEQAMQLSKDLSWERGEAMAHSSLAANYSKRSEHELAFKHYNASYKLFKSLDNNKGVAGTLANLSLLYKAKGNYTRALDYAYKALKTFEELKDSLNTAITLENIGAIFLEQKKYDKALSHFQKSQIIYKASHDLIGAARVLGNLGIIYGVQGNHNEALNHHLMALEMKQAQGNKYSQQITLANIGIAYKNLREYSKALDNLYKALAISKELGNKHSTAVNLGNIGDVYLAIANDNLTEVLPDKYILHGRNANRLKAIEYLNEAIELCQDVNFYGPMTEFSMTLSDAYLLGGDHKNALEAYKLHSHLKDSIYSIENQTTIANLETRRELELKERDIVIQENELEIAKLEFANKRKERLIFIGGFGLLIIGVSLTVQRYRKHIARQKNVLHDISQFQSHQLRGPLARILGLTQLFNFSETSDPANGKIINHIRTAALELDEVVKGIIKKAEG